MQMKKRCKCELTVIVNTSVARCESIAGPSQRTFTPIHGIIVVCGETFTMVTYACGTGRIE
jgi:hypothetical protein